MRKRMTVIAALMLCSTAMTPALAQNCTSSTRCAELGYKKSAADCDGMESLVCPFDNSKYFCLETQIEVGMILYSDGTVSDSVIPSKTPVGIVAYVNENRRFAVALEETTGYFSTGYEDVSCVTNYGSSSSAQTDFNGASNTQCIINYNGSYDYPMAEYCNTYKPVSSGTGSSGWYLPAAGELYVTSFSYGAINLGLLKLSKTQLSSKWYLSSSERDDSFVWVVFLSNGGIEYISKYSYGINGITKYHNNPVRFVLAF